MKEELAQQAKELTETKRQLEGDVDTQIEMNLSRYEKRLRLQKEEGSRLKGENGIMRKKFVTLHKDIEDIGAEIIQRRLDEKKVLNYIKELERDTIVLKAEIKERDDVIQGREKRVFDLKKNNQELEKYKFVLDYKIKELKTQIEPKETFIAQMKGQIKVAMALSLIL